MKPENLVFESPHVNAKLKIIDMGLCEYLKSQHHLQRMKGSIFYVAPEVLRKNYNHKADIWSCGVILYILITGEPPFNAKKINAQGHRVSDHDQIARMILQGTVDYRKQQFNRVDPQVVALLQMMLQMDPSQRPEADSLLRHAWFHSTVKDQLYLEGQKEKPD